MTRFKKCIVFTVHLQVPSGNMVAILSAVLAAHGRLPVAHLYTDLGSHAILTLYSQHERNRIGSRALEHARVIGAELVLLDYRSVS
jgi:hypothetical protein